jgi:hypothetical protein
MLFYISKVHFVYQQVIIVQKYASIFLKTVLSHQMCKVLKNFTEWKRENLALILAFFARCTYTIVKKFKENFPKGFLKWRETSLLRIGF